MNGKPEKFYPVLDKMLGSAEFYFTLLPNLYADSDLRNFLNKKFKNNRKDGILRVIFCCADVYVRATPEFKIYQEIPKELLADLCFYYIEENFDKKFNFDLFVQNDICQIFEFKILDIQFSKTEIRQVFFVSNKENTFGSIFTVEKNPDNSEYFLYENAVGSRTEHGIAPSTVKDLKIFLLDFAKRKKA